MLARRVSLLVGFGVVAALIAGCASDFDAGSSPTEQLCTVLASTLDVVEAPEELQLEPLVESAATDPTDIPAELLPIALAYRTNADHYDNLGRYEAAIEFTTVLVEMAYEDLAGPSTLSPNVLESLMAVDATLRSSGCTAGGAAEGE